MSGIFLLLIFLNLFRNAHIYLEEAETETARALDGHKDLVLSGHATKTTEKYVTKVLNLAERGTPIYQYASLILLAYSGDQDAIDDLLSGNNQLALPPGGMELPIGDEPRLLPAPGGLELPEEDDHEQSSSGLELPDHDDDLFPPSLD